MSADLSCTGDPLGSGLLDRTDRLQQLRDGRIEVEAGTGPELHVLSEPECIEGRTFVQCSCGEVRELFANVPPFCAVADAEADFAFAVQHAREQRDAAIARHRQRSAIEAGELRGLVGRHFVPVSYISEKR